MYICSSANSQISAKNFTWKFQLASICIYFFRMLKIKENNEKISAHRITNFFKFRLMFYLRRKKTSVVTYRNEIVYMLCNCKYLFNYVFRLEKFSILLIGIFLSYDILCKNLPMRLKRYVYEVH